ncbi:MAG: PAN domain-containing protein [Arenimonas sp.]
MARGRIMVSMSKLACKSLVVGCALLGSITAHAQVLSLEPGTDRMGGDYKGFEIGNDPVLCQRACAADTACRSFTFVRPGIKQASAMCFLKSTVPRPNADACCTSGARAAPDRGTSTPMPQPRFKPSPQAKPQPPPAPAEPEAPWLLPPPWSARVSTDLKDHIVAWQWSQHGCFPGGAGSVPKSCPFVQGIEGFRIYRLDGSLALTVSDPQRREAVLGPQPGNCYLVTAFKGDMESGPSPTACVEGPPPPHPLSTTLPVPGNLRSTTDPKACAAVVGGLLGGIICDAAMKNNSQPLLWDLSGGGIDGFRVYDTYNGAPILAKAEANPKLRVFMIEPVKGVVVNDSCFTVRSYKGEFESLPSNPICLTPKGVLPPPQKPYLLIAPSSGLQVLGVEMLKNQNSGCPFATRHTEVRASGPSDGSIMTMWLHRDTNILCGQLTAVWNESSVMFPLDAVSADFTSARLKFTAGGSVAKLGTEPGFLGTFGNAVTMNVNCIKAIHSYHSTLHDNAQDSERYGDPKAYFSWLKEAQVATSANSMPGAVNSIDVTSLVKQSLAKGKQSLGFVWEVERAMHNDNDMCAAPFNNVVLEIRPKP